MGDVWTDTDMSGLFESVTEVSKATAYKLDLTFDRRLRVWTEQILLGRMFEIQQEGTEEYVHRMSNLLIADGNRLINRATRDGVTDEAKMTSRIEIVNKIVDDQMKLYMAEIDRLKSLKGDK